MCASNFDFGSPLQKKCKKVYNIGELAIWLSKLLLLPVYWIILPNSSSSVCKDTLHCSRCNCYRTMRAALCGKKGRRKDLPAESGKIGASL